MGCEKHKKGFHLGFGKVASVTNEICDCDGRFAEGQKVTHKSLPPKKHKGEAEKRIPLELMDFDLV